MSSRIVARIILAILVPVIAAQAQQKVLAEFTPSTTYRIVVKKSHGGNDGFREVIPQLSVQSILIETGAQGASGIPVTMTVNRSRSLDAAKSAGAAEVIDWKFTFTVSPSGEMTGLDAQSSDGAVPKEVVANMLGAQLHQLLFQSAYALGATSSSAVAILSSANSSATVTDITYDIADLSGERPHDVGERGTVTTRTGTASYDASAKWFLQRTLTELSKLYIPDDAAGDGKIVQVLTVTTIDAAVTKR